MLSDVKKILVAYDFSDCAKEAVFQAHSLAKSLGAHLYLVHVLDANISDVFLSLFTLAVDADESILILLIYAAEIFVTLMLWFVFLVIMITEFQQKRLFQRFQNIVMKILGILLFAFGTHLILSMILDHLALT